MIFRIIQRLLTTVFRQGWKISVAILAFLFLTAWPALRFFEGADATIADPLVYIWWFVVTITTVGYGDFAPVTAGGRVTGITVIIGGITAMGVVFTQLTSVLLKIREAMMNGLVNVESKNHTVILGYRPGKTEELVRELRAGGGPSADGIVLCFDTEQTDGNPMPDAVAAVRGRLTSPDVLERACVADARRIVIDGRDDNETLAIAVAVRHANTDAHVVAALDDMVEGCDQIHMVSASIECVPRSIVPLAVQAVQDPGISRLYSTLMSNLTGQAGYQLAIPEGAGEWHYGELLLAFKRRFDATLIAAARSHAFDAEIVENPAWDFTVRGGMALYYVAPRRIDDIPWTELASERAAQPA